MQEGRNAAFFPRSLKPRAEKADTNSDSNIDAAEDAHGFEKNPKPALSSPTWTPEGRCLAATGKATLSKWNAAWWRSLSRTSCHH